MSLQKIKGFGFAALLVSLIIILESKAALGALHSAIDPVTGYQLAAMSLACALIAFFGFGFAGSLKDDERPHVARRAKAARFVALAFLAVPVSFLGSSLKMDRQAAEWQAYVASPLFASDRAFLADPQNLIGLSGSILEQQRRVVEPTVPNLSALDGEFWVALALQFLLIFASDALRVPTKITEAEAKHWRAVRAAHKGLATKRRNAAKKAEKARKPLLRIVR